MKLKKTAWLLPIIFLTFLTPFAAFANSEAPVEEEGPQNIFLSVPPISVAMYNKRKRPSGSMTVVIKLKIDDNEQRHAAEKLMPRLKNAYMEQTLNLAFNFFDINRPVNANMLSRSLQNVTNQILKHTHAKVLIGDIAVHKR